MDCSPAHRLKFFYDVGLVWQPETGRDEHQQRMAAKGEHLHWNHLVSLCFLILAVYFMFKK